MKRLIKWIKKICGCRYPFRLMFGYRYLINHGSKEVHDLTKEHVNCHLHAIKKREYAKRKRAIALMDMTVDYNGCRFCNKKYDTDGYKK